LRQSVEIFLGAYVTSMSFAYTRNAGAAGRHGSARSACRVMAFIADRTAVYVMTYGVVGFCSRS
jgi:hypothetical protein